MAEYIERSYIRKMAMFEMAYTMETETDAAVVLRMIDDAPAADVAPVVRGWWVRKNQHDKESSVICSVCGRMFDYIDGVCYLVSGSELPFFCPACGAKMDGKEDKDG